MSNSNRMRLRRPEPAPPGDRSFWLRDVADRIPHPKAAALTGIARADVAIVGGGYTGLWTALRLMEKRPDLRVVVAEADFCGSGASGRNGGQVHSSFHELDLFARVLSLSEAVEFCQATVESIGELRRLQDDVAVDMGLRLDGWLWTASSLAQEGAWEPALSLLEEAGVSSPFEPVDAEAIAETTGSTASYAGVVESFAGTVQPAKLALGLRDLAIERGVAVHEGTPVTAIEPGATCRLRTPRGRIEADRVVLAEGAWLSSVPEVRRHMYVVDSQVIATEPMPDRLDAIGWTGGQSICDAQDQVLYYQRTGDGRVVLGRGSGGPVFGDRLGEKTNRHPRWVRDSVRELHRVYPSLRGARIDHDWLGPIDCVPSHVPVFDRLRGHDNVVYAAGWNGTGIAQIPVGSRILASLALGDDDWWSRSGLVGIDQRATLPPEPLRYAGARLVRAAISRKNAREIRNEEAGPLTRAIVALMPGGD